MGSGNTVIVTYEPLVMLRILIQILRDSFRIAISGML